MLDTLLPELQACIFRYLKPRDMKNLALCDKAHHAAMKPFVFNNVNVSWKRLQVKEALDGMDLECFQYTETLQFNDCTTPVDQQKNRQIITTNFERLLHFTDPIVLFLYSCHVTDSMFTVIASMSNLVKLSMISGTTCDRDVEVICKHLKQLTKLKIDGSRQVTDVGLQNISNLSVLEELKVGGSSITGDGLEFISSLKYLRKLDVGFCVNLRLDGFRHLVGLPLVELRIPGIAPSQDWSLLHYVASIKSLLYLDVGLNPISDHVSHLAGLQRLHTLDVTGCGIGDDGVKFIVATLKSLKKLNLSTYCMTLSR